jgi:hypothetical protein
MQFNEVTTLSKIIAATVFIVLPFAGVIIGYNYGYELGYINGRASRDLVEIHQTNTDNVEISVSPTISIIK